MGVSETCVSVWSNSGFDGFVHSATAIADVHFDSSKPCKVHYPTVEIRVLAFEGTYFHVISVISDSAQLRSPAICYMFIESGQKCAKLTLFGVL